MKNKILLLLGDKDEYLDYRVFNTDEELDKFLDSIAPLMTLNITKELPLRKRLLQLPKDDNGEGVYFPFAGAVQGFEVIDLDPKDEEENE